MCAVGLPERYGQRVKWGNPANPGFKGKGEWRYNHKPIPLAAMHPCIVGHVAQQFGDHYKSRPASSTSRAYGNTTDVYLAVQRTERIYYIGLDVGAAYVNNIWLGFSFEIGGGHTPLPLELSCYALYYFLKFVRVIS